MNIVKQSPLSFIAEIDPSKKETLLKTLSDINNDIEDNTIIPFAKIESIHFARFIVLDEQGKYPPYLVFFSNYDGDLDAHLEEVIEQSKDGFGQVFGACKDFPKNADTGALKSFLRKNSKYRAFFYRGTWGRSVKQICEEEVSRVHSEDFLDANDSLRTTSPNSIIEKVKEALEGHSKLKQFARINPPKLISFTRIVVLVLLVPVVIALLPVILIWVIVLRILETTDKPQEVLYSDLNKTLELKADEDKIVQNQITHLVEVKPGLVRYVTLRLVLEAIYFLSRVLFNKGRLGNISTIHFARWVLIDKGKRLLFTSNFDGSWESYLSDFVDRAAVGLTAVWSNTKGFPRSKFLAFKGATDEQRFKSWTRKHQVQTQAWYSAYKHLSVQNINNNTRINESLFEIKENELQSQLDRY